MSGQHINRVTTKLVGWALFQSWGQQRACSKESNLRRSGSRAAVANLGCLSKWAFLSVSGHTHVIQRWFIWFGCNRLIFLRSKTGSTGRCALCYPIMHTWSLQGEDASQRKGALSATLWTRRAWEGEDMELRFQQWGTLVHRMRSK